MKRRDRKLVRLLPTRSQWLASLNTTEFVKEYLSQWQPPESHNDCLKLPLRFSLINSGVHFTPTAPAKEVTRIMLKPRQWPYRDSLYQPQTMRFTKEDCILLEEEDRLPSAAYERMLAEMKASQLRQVIGSLASGFTPTHTASD